MSEDLVQVTVESPADDGSVTLPTVVSEGVVEVLGVKIRTYQLDNGQRIMNEDDVNTILTQMFADEIAVAEKKTSG